jgi:ATP-dependent helicase/nuclease subunit A
VRLAGLDIDLPAESTPESFTASRDALVAASRRRAYTSATAEVSETADPASRKQDAEDASEPWARGRGGTRLGRAVHATIQSLAWDATDAEIQAFSRAQAVAEAIPQRAGDVARLARRALDSDAAGRAVAAKRALREVPFAVQSGDVTLEGFMDLVIESQEGLEIVDWKTDQIGWDDVEARVADYALQAGLYVLGLETALSRPVNRVTYVFVSAGREISPGDPQNLAEQARRHLSARAPAPPAR